MGKNGAEAIRRVGKVTSEHPVDLAPGVEAWRRVAPP
jgi:hypothetical protein